MNVVKNDNYVCIQGWMINELKLKDNELLVYAIIYGFSQDHENTFAGSLSYLASWCSCTKQGIMKNLKSLLEKGFIGKKESNIKNIKLVEYYATKFNGGMQLSLPNNIEDNKVNIEKEIIKEKELGQCPTNVHTLSDIIFKKPTIEDIIDYCVERNNHVDPYKFFDFYESKGWMVGKTKMKDWKAAVRTWEKANKSITKKDTPEWHNEYKQELEQKQQNKSKIDLCDLDDLSCFFNKK